MNDFNELNKIMNKREEVYKILLNGILSICSDSSTSDSYKIEKITKVCNDVLEVLK